VTELSIIKTSGLAPDRHNFCHFLAADPQMNGVTAYLKIKPEAKHATAANMANRWIKEPEVRLYVGVLLEARQKRLEMDEDWVIHRLREICDRCMQAVPYFGAGNVVTVDDDGEVIPREPLYYKFDSTGAIKSLELIGKHMRMFSDKVDIAQMNVVMNMNFGGERPAIEGEFKRVGKS